MGARVTGNNTEDKRCVIQLSKYMFAHKFPNSLKVGVLGAFETVRDIVEGSLDRELKYIF